MFLRFFTTIIFGILLVFTVSAQNGKVIGKIVDQETGQPLIGANVLVVGTLMGAASDVDGNFMISNIPVGKYNIKASYIGYRDVTVQNIEVFSNLSTEVNFKLPSQSLTTGEIVIVRKRPLVQKSATNAIRFVSSKDLETLPIREISGVIALQAGVVFQNGRTFIRGGRADETGYMLEGVDVKNVVSRNGGNMVTIIPDAIQEINVQAGGYNAEYGNANAGIISQNFKSGSNKYKFSLRMETDNFGNYPGEKFLGTYSYGYTDYTVTFSGPILSKKLTIFLAGENRFVRDYSPRFFSPNPATFSDGARFDQTKIKDSGALGGDTSGAQILTWQGGNIPGRMQNVYSLNGNITLNVNPLILRVNGAFSSSRRRNNSSTIINMFDLNRLGISDRSNLFLNLKATYLISSNTFVEANFNFLDNRTKTYDQDLGDNYLTYSDSLVAAEHGWSFKNFSSGPNRYDFYGFPFTRPGALLTNYGKSKWNNFGGNFNFTTQYKKHELKAGASYQKWIIRNYSVGGSSSILTSIINNPDLVRDPKSLTLFFQTRNTNAFQNIYGYDLFGNESNSGFFDAKRPVIASAYIQDKYEFNDLVINAGLRFDYFDMDSWKLTNPDNPQFNKNTFLPSGSEFIKSGSYQYVSPKLGFAFPITDRTVFHLQYGKYVQSPGLDVSYKGILFASRIFLNAGNAFNDPIAFDPKPIRTTQYEIGFTQQFSDYASFDITAFYKDIKGQLQYHFQNLAPGNPNTNYPTYINQDFATTKGLEFTLRLRRINRLRADLNYTYSNAQGTNSFATSGFGSVQVDNNVPTVIQALDFDQTHRGSISLDYRFDKNDGGPILEQLGVSFLFTFHSGHPFTIAQAVGLGQSSAWTGGIIGSDTRQRKPNGPINATNTPWVYNLNLRIDKTVSISKFNVNFYVYVQNLLNTQNVINVYNKTGNAYDDGFLGSQDAFSLINSPTGRYTQRFADLYKALNLTNRQHSFLVKGIDMFGTPRQIRAGILINF